MARNVNDTIKKLGAARRQKVEVRAAQLIAEEMTLREVRSARKLTLQKSAKARLKPSPISNRTTPSHSSAGLPLLVSHLSDIQIPQRPPHQRILEGCRDGNVARQELVGSASSPAACQSRSQLRGRFWAANVDSAHWRAPQTFRMCCARPVSTKFLQHRRGALLYFL